MNLCLGNMWSVYSQADFFGFTANSTLVKKWIVRPSGLRVETHHLVMGTGFAREIRDYHLTAVHDNLYPLWENVTEHMGRMVFNKTGCNEGRFDLAFYEPLKLFAFQVKYHFKLTADLRLIRHSAKALADWMTEHPGQSVHLNFPGIGAGLASPKVVFPYLESLRDTDVNLWVKWPVQYKAIKELMV